MDDMVPREEISRQAMRGFGRVAGGIGVLVLRAIAASSLVGGLVVGGAITLGGLLLSRSRDDRNAGIVAMVAGGITVLAAVPVLTVIAKPLMLLSGLGLLLAGGWSLFKFFRGLRGHRG